MKTAKLWRLAFAMLAAFSLASCSSDDDSNVYEAAELGGTWQKVYDEGVADAGHLLISPKPDDTSETLTVDCDIRSLTSTQMIWNKPGTNEEISRFKKVK